jgi:hypothetical protein
VGSALVAVALWFDAATLTHEATGTSDLAGATPAYDEAPLRYSRRER